VIIANRSNPIQTKSSSKNLAANVPLGSINLATTVSESAALTRKPCPGRVAASVQLGGVSLVGTV
jgi:hypothetical protein